MSQSQNEWSGSRLNKILLVMWWPAQIVGGPKCLILGE